MWSCNSHKISAIKSIPAIILLCLSVLINAYAQRWETGSWGGTSNYFGDLNQDYSFKELYPASGVLLRVNFDHFLATRTTISVAKVGFSDAYSKNNWQRERNLSFFSDIYEISQTMEINFLELDKGSYDRRMTPYFMAGMGIFYYHPKAIYESGIYSLQSLGTEGQNSPLIETPDKYLLVKMAFPLGGGFKYSFNEHWCWGAEIGYRLTTTDYIDDVSTIYPDPALLYRYNLTDQEIAVLLSDPSTGNGASHTNRQRGNSRTKDQYLFLGLEITYTFKSPICPSIF